MNSSKFVYLGFNLWTVIVNGILVLGFELNLSYLYILKLDLNLYWIWGFCRGELRAGPVCLWACAFRVPGLLARHDGLWRQGLVAHRAPPCRALPGRAWHSLMSCRAWQPICSSITPLNRNCSMSAWRQSWPSGSSSEWCSGGQEAPTSGRGVQGSLAELNGQDLVDVGGPETPTFCERPYDEWLRRGWDNCCESSGVDPNTGQDGC